MKTLKSMVAVVAGLASLIVQTHAHLITPEGNLYVGSNDKPSIMSSLLGTPVVLLFKQEYNDGVLGASEGPLGPLGTYFQIESPLNGDANEARISWDLTMSGYHLYAVAWKDGVLINSPGEKGFYWSGVTEDQRVVGGPDEISTQPAFRGAVSHIAFYGVYVPDGGTTLMLLGVAFTGLGVVNRYVRRGKG